MRKFCSFFLLAALFGAPVLIESVVASPVVQESQTTVPQNRTRRRGYEGRRRHRGIRRAFGKAGRSAGRGGRDFGRNIARGKPIKASRRLGRGMGGFGKHTGQGTARIGRRAARGVRRIVH